MQGTVSAKSPYGFKVEGREGWINYGKFYKGTKEYNVGDVVEYEVKVNGNFTNLVSLVINDRALQQTESQDVKARGSYLRSDTRTEIARSTAIKAVFDSPVLAYQFKDMDLSQAVQSMKNLVPELTNYILTGKFDVSQVIAEVSTNGTK